VRRVFLIVISGKIPIAEELRVALHDVGSRQLQIYE